jgi:hypothetical protein
VHHLSRKVLLGLDGRTWACREGGDFDDLDHSGFAVIGWQPGAPSTRPGRMNPRMAID